MKRQFTPPGFALNDALIAAAFLYLFPELGMDENNLPEISQELMDDKLLEAIHLVRGLLYESKLSAYYVSEFSAGGLVAVPQSFWLDDAADRALASGEYWPFGTPTGYNDRRPKSALFFKMEEIAVVFRSTDDNEISRSTGGRPEKKVRAAQVYREIYPHGQPLD